MKKLIYALFLALAASVSGYAQSLTITPKETVYTRKGKVSMKEKRTFVVIYPIVSGKIPLATKKRVENSISYWRVFGTTLKENLSEYDWLSNLSYEVNYNKNGILDIALTQEGSGAYPSQSTTDIIVDLKTGNQVKFIDAFKAGTLEEFAKLVDAKLKMETKDIVKMIDKGEFGKNGKEADDSLKEQLSGLTFTSESFDEYSISDEGVTIIYDAGFPHVIQAAAPDGRFLFKWSELKPFIKPEGLLGKFVR